MSGQANAFLNFGAIDKLSQTVEKIKGKFSGLTNAVNKVQNSFKVLDEKTKHIQKMGDSFQKTGLKMSVGLTAPIALAGRSMISTAIDYQKSINRVGAITQTIVTDMATGITKPTEEFAKLDKKAQELGASTVFSAGEVADAMGFLAQAGFDTNTVLKTIAPTLDLASASGTGLAESAEITSGIMNAFKIEAGDLGRVADVLVQVTNKTGAGMLDLGEAMKYVAPVANQFGASLEETAALTGLLANIGVKGSVAGTSLKALFLGLADPSTKAAKLLQHFGVQVTDTNGKMRKATDILADLGPKIGALNQDQQLAVISALFGERGMVGASELLSQSSGGLASAINKTTEALRASKGAATQAANALKYGAVGSVDEFSSSLEGLYIAFANSGVLTVFTFLLKILTGFFNLLTALPKPVQFIISSVLALLAALGPFLLMLGSIMKVWPTILLGFKGLAVAVGWLGTVWAWLVVGFKVALAIFSALFSWVGLIIAAVAALGLAAYLLWKNWEPVKQFFIDLFTDPYKALLKLVDLAKSAGSSIAKFFGYGKAPEETAQGASRSQVFGAPLGAQAVSQQINPEYVTRTNNARVDVNVRAPESAQVTSYADGDFLNLNLGRTGGY